MDHSSTFGFSPRLPVSVCGTGHNILALADFLGSLITTLSDCPKTLGTIRFDIQYGFAYTKYIYTLQRTIPSVRMCVTTSSPLRLYYGYWNINQLSIGISITTMDYP